MTCQSETTLIVSQREKNTSKYVCVTIGGTTFCIAQQAFGKQLKSVSMLDLEAANRHISRMTYPTDSVVLLIILVLFRPLLSPGHPAENDLKVG